MTNDDCATQKVAQAEYAPISERRTNPEKVNSQNLRPLAKLLRVFGMRASRLQKSIIKCKNGAGVPSRRRSFASGLFVIFIIAIVAGGVGIWGYIQKNEPAKLKPFSQGEGAVSEAEEKFEFLEDIEDFDPETPAKNLTGFIGKGRQKNPLEVNPFHQAEDALARQDLNSVETTEGLDVEIPAKNLKGIGSAAIDVATGDLRIKTSGDGFVWKGKVETPGRYQVWVTHFSENESAKLVSNINDMSKAKNILNMDASLMSRIYGENDKKVRVPKRKNKSSETSASLGIDPYYFREYLGSYDIDQVVKLSLSYRDCQDIRVNKLELVKEGRYLGEMEELLFSGIDYYVKGQKDGVLARCIYDTRRDQYASLSSIAVCGLALVAHSLNHELGRSENSEAKVLELLRACNGKVPGINLARHSSGLFMHFVNPVTGVGTSEFSTIDTSILISGALIARNTFKSAKIKSEADELWNSIDWSKFVVSTDPAMPRFYLSGKQIDGIAKGSISMYNEYILLAYYCQKYEDQKYGIKARKHIMPDLYQLPRLVFRDRVILSFHIQPSFLVQFPFYMSNLCADEQFFSYTAAQGVADRSVGISRSGDRSAWGVSPGSTPKSGYSVDNFFANKEGVVRPRIVAGFIPVLPKAAEDLYLRYKDPENRLNLKFGTILPGFVPDNDKWKAWRIPGVDFCSLMFGMAAHHPKLGIRFFEEKTKFSFNSR